MHICPQFLHFQILSPSLLNTNPFSKLSNNFLYLSSCSFSIFATPSNKFAICWNPSSLASFANLSYISVHSKFSPSAAAFKFSAVPGTPLFNNLNHIFACSFSLSAVSWNIAAICSYPSFFALLAKYVYLFLACDSPANASIKFFSVFEPFKSAIDYYLLPFFTIHLYHRNRLKTRIFTN